MPYPPPPGPAALGIFQAIGLVPELPSLVGNYFLTNSGGLTVWSPVSGGVLPDMAGHGGEFLTTDGATASWSAITGPGTGLYSNIFDIRNYGALSVNNPNDRTLAIHDCSDAIEAAIAAWVQTNTTPMFSLIGKVGGVYVPAGNWYISRPIITPIGCTLYGDGPQLSVIMPGVGLASEPTLVPAFGGPTIYDVGKPSDPVAFFPKYGSPLVGATGRSMQLQRENVAPPAVFPPSLDLDHCYPWSMYLFLYAAQISLRCWAKLPAWSDTGNGRWLIGCLSHLDDRAISIHATTNGTTVQYVATLTTAITGKQTIISSAVASNAVVNLEIDYNGSFFDFYVDGVNQGHVAMTGKVYKYAWEQAVLGDNPAVLFDFFPQPDGYIDSIEMSDVARHTGVGGFTPPTSKYTADSHTIWLCNFDQPDVPDNQPMVLAQTAVLTINTPADTYQPVPTFGMAQSQPSHGGLVPHYMPVVGYALGYIPNNAGVTIRDLQICGKFNNSGLLCERASRTRLQRLIVFGCSAYGVKLWNNNSFYSEAEDIWVDNRGVGILWFGNLFRAETHGCQIGLWGASGNFHECADQPEWQSFIPYVWGPAGDTFSGLVVTGGGNDEEGTFLYQFSAAYAISIDRAVFINNAWDVSGQPNVKCAFYYKLTPRAPPNHIGDVFGVFDPVPAISGPTGLNNGPIYLVNCTFAYPNNGSIWTDTEGMVVRNVSDGASNQRGISTSDVLANNLAGTFTVMYGYTSGGPAFITPEPDGDYVVEVTPKSYVGSAPAVGSTEVVAYTTSTTGFTVTLGADPGGTCIITFSYVLIRTPSGPLYYSYLPTLPSTITNPLVTASPTGDYFVGVTLIPVGANAFRYNRSLGPQTVLSTGPAFGGWTTTLDAGGPTWEWSVSVGTPDFGSTGFIAGPIFNHDSVVLNGRLYGMANPGPHNVIFGIGHGIRGLGEYAWQMYTDGGYDKATQFIPGGAPNYGTQQTPIYVGQDSVGGTLLTTATLRNLKISTQAPKVYTFEQDAGPQAVHVTQGAFFGDAFTVGLEADAAGLGGFATQIAENRYAGTAYWWLAAGVETTAALGLSEFWGKWGTNQTLSGICILLGFRDIGNDGATGAVTWDHVRQICEGTYATSSFTPPIYSQRAWAGYVPPFRGIPGPHTGSATCVINGVSFTCTYNTDDTTTINDLIALINLDAPTMALVTPSLVGTFPAQYMRIDAVVDGFGGNGITTNTDFAHGAYWYPGPATFDGIDTTCVINGVTFHSIFDTDADTTVNNLIALVNADVPTAALVTPTLVNHKMLVTANSAGVAGNSITVTTNTFGGASWTNFVDHLTGGSDGAIGHVPAIVVCTLPPFGDAPFYSAGKETQRQAFNTAAAAFAAAHGGDGVVLADVDVTVRSGADHTKIDPTLLSPDNIHLNDAGHAALVALINPLLP